MMKEVIILTKSDKNSNYCVAGVERENGKWIRLENKNLTGYAVSEEDITYADGTECQVLDIVEAKCLDEEAALHYQPENVYLDLTQKLRKIGEASWADVFAVHPVEIRSMILNSRFDRMSEEYAKNTRYSRSLQLIQVKDLKISISQKEDDRYKHPKGIFTYVNNLNEEIEYMLTVTDPDYCPALQERQIENPYMIISLGGLYNGHHYLLIAKIIESVEEPFFVTTSSNTGIQYYHKDRECGLLRYIGSAEKYSSGKIVRDGVQPCVRCSNK